MVSLAFQLEDERLLGQVRTFLDWTLEHQGEDGWIGPEPFVANATTPRLVWPRYLMLLGLIVRRFPLFVHSVRSSTLQQYAEADSSQTERIIDAMHKFMSLVNTIWKTNQQGTPDMGFQFDYQYVRWEEVCNSSSHCVANKALIAHINLACCSLYIRFNGSMTLHQEVFSKTLRIWNSDTETASWRQGSRTSWDHGACPQLRIFVEERLVCRLYLPEAGCPYKPAHDADVSFRFYFSVFLSHESFFSDSHGVNTAEGKTPPLFIVFLWISIDSIHPALKSEALAWRFTGDNSDIQNTFDRLDMLYAYHGRASGELKFVLGTLWKAENGWAIKVHSPRTSILLDSILPEGKLVFARMSEALIPILIQYWALRRRVSGSMF